MYRSLNSQSKFKFIPSSNNNEKLLLITFLINDNALFLLFNRLSYDSLSFESNDLIYYLFNPL